MARCSNASFLAAIALVIALSLSAQVRPCRAARLLLDDPTFLVVQPATDGQSCTVADDLSMDKMCCSSKVAQCASDGASNFCCGEVCCNSAIGQTCCNGMCCVRGNTVPYGLED